MATNEDNAVDTGKSLVRTAVGMSPLFAAAYYGGLSLKANEAINIPLSQSNAFNQLGKRIGATAKDVSIRAIKAREDSAKRIQDRVRGELDKAEGFQALLKNGQERNSLLQALALTLDDPSLGIEDSARVRLKQQVIEAAQNSAPEPERAIREILEAVSNTAKDDVASRFGQLQSQFAEVGAQLEAPKMQIPRSGVSFTSIPHANLSRTERDYVSQISKSLGNDFTVEVKGYSEFGRNQRVAQVFQRGADGPRYKTTVPLTNATYFRSGQSGRTLYAMPRRMMDVEKASSILERGGPKNLIKGSMISTPEFFIGQMERRSQGGGYFDFADWNSFMQGHMTNVDRVASSGESFSSHVRFQAEAKMSTVGLFNIDRLHPRNQQQAIASIARATRGMLDPGIGGKRVLSRSDDGLMGSLGIHKGSFLNKLQDLYGSHIDRTMVPLTLREFQITGRHGMFAGPSFQIGRSGLVGGSMMHAAEQVATGRSEDALRTALRQVSMFGELTSGGLGAVTVMDVSKSGKMSVGAGSEGVAFTGQRQLVRNPVQFGVLDPQTHKYLSSTLLERLHAAGDSGVHLTADELKSGMYLGETGNGSKFLPFDDRTKSMWLRLSEVTEDAVAGGTRRTVSVSGFTEKSMDIFKLFGLSFKANTQVVDNVLGNFDPNAQRALKGVLGTLGIEERSIIAGPSDMMSKGAIGFMHQIAGGTRIVSQGGISIDELRDRASKVASRSKQVFDIYREPGKAMEVEYKPLASFAQGAMELMHMKGIDPAHIGLVMSGVYHGAEGSSSKYGLKQDSILQLGKMLWGGKSPKFQAFSEAINLGVTIGYDVFQLGESVNDWGRARAGVEPRFAKTLHERLLGFGLDMNTASDVVAGMYRHKVGLAPHYTLAANLLDMTRFTSGGSTAMDFVSGKATRMSWKQLTEQGILGTGNKTNTLSELLRGTKGGIHLDFSDAPESIRRAAKEVFHQGELFLPGAEAFESAKGTMIKQANGKSAVIESELGQLMNSLGDRLTSYTADSRTTVRSLSEWKRKANGLFANVVDQLHSGKIRGGISPTVMPYDLTVGTGPMSDPRLLARARRVYLHSRGQAVFQEAESFASQLSDMTGTMSKKELGFKARNFFTSMETGTSKMWTGLAGVSGRHPMMSTGNVFVTQTFRHLGEVSALGQDDAFFNKIKNSEVGQKMLRGAFGTTDVQSFRQVRKFSEQQQKTFFDSFIDNLGHFTSGQNAGVQYVPSMKTTAGNVGIGIQAFMDSDGDHSLHFFFDGPMGKKVMRQMRTNGDAVALQDFKQRSFFNVMSEQTKGALGNMRDRFLRERPGMSVDEKLWQDTMKEIGLSMNTGKLDVGLRGIHEAIGLYEGDITQKTFGRMFLANLQENVVIKSKKLPVYTNLPERIASVSNKFMETGNIDELHGLIYELFGEQDIGRGGMRVKGDFTLLGADAKFQQAFADRMGKGIDTSYHLDDFLRTAERAVKTSVSRGTNRTLTKGRLIGDLSDDPMRAMSLLLGGPTMEGGGFEGFMGQSLGAKTSFAADQLKQAASKVDAHMTGRLALGAVGSAALLGMMSGGYSPEPIIMPGENPSGSVLDRISSGSVFNRADPDISPENLANVPTQYDRMTPINTGAMYATRPNAFQLRGEVSSASGLSTFGSYFGQLTNGAGRGVVTINDQRRPITPNYVDRLMGEY